MKGTKVKKIQHSFLRGDIILICIWVASPKMEQFGLVFHCNFSWLFLTKMYKNTPKIIQWWVRLWADCQATISLSVFIRTIFKIQCDSKNLWKNYLWQKAFIASWYWQICAEQIESQWVLMIFCLVSWTKVCVVVEYYH